MKLRELLYQEMVKQKSNPTEISRDAKLNVATIRRALEVDGKMSVYEAIARALNVKITYKVD
jgi:DNA-binding phage protein